MFSFNQQNMILTLNVYAEIKLEEVGPIEIVQLFKSSCDSVEGLWIKWIICVFINFNNLFP